VPGEVHRPDIELCRFKILKETAARNVLIHDYIEVDLEAVWLTVNDDLPEAEGEIRRIIKELGDD